MDVGFVGLGTMGKAMALCLLKAGHRLRVWNRSPGPLAELRQHGAVAVATPGEAFGGDVFISMLADDAAVRSVTFQALAAATGSTIHLAMSTISVGCAKELAAWHAEKQLTYLAAPVLGRPEVAAAGQLHILVAGPGRAIAKVEPLLNAMGQRVWRFGEEPSRANVIKIAANLTLACAIEAMAESAALVSRHGVCIAEFIDLLTHSLFSAPAYQGYGDLIARRHYQPAGFKLSLGLKDVRLALGAGESANVPLPFASVLRDNFLDAIAHGDGGKDWSAVAEVAARRAGLAP